MSIEKSNQTDLEWYKRLIASDHAHVRIEGEVHAFGGPWDGPTIRPVYIKTVRVVLDCDADNS